MFGNSSLNQFIQEITRYPLLSPEQELIFCRQINAMNQVLSQPKPYTKEQSKTIKVGKRAKSKFVNSNLRMVINIAKKYNHRTTHLELSDLISEGIIGLIKAVEKYDGSRGYRFSTYAYWWIKQSINRSIAVQERAIRLPVNVEDDIVKYKKASNELSAKLGRFPNHEEIANELKCDKSTVTKLENITLSVASLDTVVSNQNDSTSTLIDLVADQSIENPYDSLERLIMSERVHIALSYLSDHEQYVIKHRYGLAGFKKQSILDISKKLNISRESVKKHLSRAQNKIRLQLKENLSLDNTPFTYSTAI